LARATVSDVDDEYSDVEVNLLDAVHAAIEELLGTTSAVPRRAICLFVQARFEGFDDADVNDGIDGWIRLGVLRDRGDEFIEYEST
jgi:hypothetical protein